MFGSFNFTRIFLAAALLAASVPAALTIGADGAAYAQSRGGGGGGGGNGGGGDGGGAGPGETPLSFILIDNDDKAPPCTAGAGCNKPPQITYIAKKNACEIRTCEIEYGVRKCSVEMTDIKVCSTKRS